MLIMYKNDDEMIITTLENDHECLRLYFIEGGRDIDMYERIEINEKAIAFSVSSQLKCDVL